MSIAHAVRLAIQWTQNHSCPVHIEHGLLGKLPRIISKRWSGRGLYIITDSNVSRLYGLALRRGLAEQGVKAPILEIPAGESSKSMARFTALTSQVLAHGVKRDSLVLALGGGVVGDLAGFVAATVLRGVSYVQIPTTVVSQVDSSIGGKVGINHRTGKNLIGAFHFPEVVYIDPAVLKTLSQQHFMYGLAEVVKIAFALDPSFFRWLERNHDRLHRDNMALVRKCVSSAAALKAEVVRLDPSEQGLRKVLNFGHSVGHAIEAATGFDIPHGAAVSIGLVEESRIAAEMGILERTDFLRLVRLLECFHLPIAFPPRLNKKKFFSALALDKKADGAGVKFVLPKRVGSMLIGIRVPATIFRRE